MDFDVRIPSGRVRVRRFGEPEAPLVLCLPGLSANLASFDFIAERIAGSRLSPVAVDLRGRGHSEVTGPGTYGWRNHARDVFAIADALGAAQFSIIGQSMGGAVAMEAAAIDADRIDRIVLLDICGVPDPASVQAIAASVARLGQVAPSAETYVSAIKATGLIDPWSEYWDRYFAYELEPVEGGVRSRSNRDAVLEDSAYMGEQTPYPLWERLTMPVLLLRASREILPGFGRIVSDADAARFPQEVPTATLVPVEANHYTVNTSDASVAAIREFFGLD
jgi:pimeloyl-ACP methyl ester carboxylesterase